jgi:hypothetical protein
MRSALRCLVLVSLALLPGAGAAAVKHKVVQFQSGLAGGQVQGSVLAKDCPGFFPTQPQVRWEAVGARPLWLTVLSDGGTVVGVRYQSADGNATVRCGGSRDSSLLLPAGAREVELLVGSEAPEVFLPFLWHLDEKRAPPRILVVAGMNEQSWLPEVLRKDWLLFPEENVTTARQETPLPGTLTGLATMRLKGVALGGVDTGRYSAVCDAYMPATPQHLLRVESGETPRRIEVFADEPVALEVRLPDGTAHCVRSSQASLALTLQEGLHTLSVSSLGGGERAYVVSTSTEASRKGALGAKDLRLLISHRKKSGSNFKVNKLVGGKPAHGSPTALVKMGTGAVAGTSPGRAEALRAVVRLRESGRMVCTGTLVEYQGEEGILTAAHCLFRPGPGGVLTGQLRRIEAQGLGPLVSEQAKLASGFRGCVEARMTYAGCLAQAVPDVAFVPLARAAPPELVRWSLCEDPPARPGLAAFGYGLDRGRLPAQLLTASFDVEARPRVGPWQARGVGPQRVALGDSGGPVLTEIEDQTLETRVPQVCFVIAASQRGSLENADDLRATALLQPVWLLSQRIPWRRF